MDKIFLQLTDALKKNNMAVFYAETKQDVVPIVRSLLKKGETIGKGGSESVAECGVLDLVKNGDYNFLDRSTCPTEEETQAMCHQMLLADTFLTSTNAITMDGVLYNVDGNSNRVSNIAYGAKQVIVIVGKNKIVNNLQEAILRVRTVAAPKNTGRKHPSTPCEFNGKCICADNPSAQMTDGCDAPKRMCCNYLISAKQRIKDRIKIVLVNENLGY